MHAAETVCRLQSGPEPAEAGLEANLARQSIAMRSGLERWANGRVGVDSHLRGLGPVDSRFRSLDLRARVLEAERSGAQQALYGIITAQPLTAKDCVA